MKSIKLGQQMDIVAPKQLLRVSNYKTGIILFEGESIDFRFCKSVDKYRKSEVVDLCADSIKDAEGQAKIVIYIGIRVSEV